MKNRSWTQRFMMALFGLGGVFLAGFVMMRLGAANAPRPSTLGATNGQLAPCPDSPNCVTTQQGLDSQKMAALSYTGSREAAQDRLRALVAGLERTTLITDEPGYMHVEFRTKLIGYIDDVEFVFDEASSQIHFRSASRLGYGDQGLNRQRMQMITDLWGSE